MRVGPLRISVMILRGENPLEASTDERKQSARAHLMKVTGQDFGLDADKWEKWLKANMPNEYY